MDDRAVLPWQHRVTSLVVDDDILTFFLSVSFCTKKHFSFNAGTSSCEKFYSVSSVASAQQKYSSCTEVTVCGSSPGTNFKNYNTLHGILVAKNHSEKRKSQPKTTTLKTKTQQFSNVLKTYTCAHQNSIIAYRKLSFSRKPSRDS